MNPSTIYMLSFLLLKAGIELAGVGTIVGSAFGDSSYTRTALVILVQSSAALVAFFVGRTRKIQSYPISKQIASMLFISVGIVFTEVFSIFWFILMALQMATGTIVISKFQALIPQYFSEQKEQINRKFQLGLTIVNVFSFSIAPILAVNWGIRSLFIVLMVCAFLSCLCYRMFSSGNKEGSKENIPIAKFRGFSNLKYLSIHLTVLYAWLVMGVFEVIEIPLLVKKFSMSSLDITSIFLLTMVSNFLAVKMLPQAFILNDKKVQYCSILGIILSSAIYVYTENYWLLLLSVAGFGVFNGLFNLAISNFLVTRIPEFGDRMDVALLNRVCMRVGVLISVMLLLIFSDSEYTIFVAYLIFALVAILATVSKFYMVAILAVVIQLGSISDSTAKELDSKFAISIPVRGLPSVLDPAELVDIGSALVLGQIFDGLYEFSKDNTLRPVLAKSHSISPKGDVILIEIDQSVRFSDGTILTSKIVENSFKRIIEKMGIKLGWAFKDVQGFNEFVGGNGKWSDVGIRSLNDKELEIDLKQPSSDFMQVISAPYLAVA